MSAAVYYGFVCSLEELIQYFPESKEEMLDKYNNDEYNPYKSLSEFPTSKFITKTKTIANIVCDFEKLYGKQFSFLNENEPDTVFMAQGSPVAILHKNNL